MNKYYFRQSKDLSEGPLIWSLREAASRKPGSGDGDVLNRLRLRSTIVQSAQPWGESLVGRRSKHFAKQFPSFPVAKQFAHETLGLGAFHSLHFCTELQCP